MVTSRLSKFQTLQFVIQKCVHFRCTTLQELVLTDNFLTELPSSIGNLTKLTNLNVDRNRLEYIPREIGNLVNLGEIRQ